MGIPRVPDQVRRAPLLALRAVFASIGRAVMVADRPPSVVVADEPASLLRPLDKTGNVRILPAQQAAPPQETAPARDLADEGARPTPPTSPVATEIADTPELPLPNYDTLSLGSIRARLRFLDVAQLKVLLDHEAANAERAEVLGMYERRIEKLKAGA